MELKAVIGLEIHAELKTKSKMFCSCKNDFEEKEPNKNVCPVCMGHPGTLPVINEKAVDMVIKTGLALNCSVNETSRFDRKNYFYPDLPKGYQISQYALPLCKEGYMDIGDKRIRIRRIHLEEDTARLIHSEKDDCSLVDFNRAGIPLMELVTEPDIASGIEARIFAQDLQLIFQYLGVSDADMEKGNMRIEPNISISQDGVMGTKVEVKNLNSFRSVEKALNYEILRQVEAIKNKEKIVQETRGWDDIKGITYSQRSKEEAHDYRYFPEPDLPPMEFSKAHINRLKLEVPELPKEKFLRLKEQYFLSDDKAQILVSDIDLGNYFEAMISEVIHWSGASKIDKEGTRKAIQIAINYLTSDGVGLLKGKDFNKESFPITPENFAEFAIILFEKNFNSKMAKTLLEKMFVTKKDPSEIIEEEGLNETIEDEGEIDKIAQKIIEENKSVVEDYKKGKQNALQFLIGQIMKETKGKIDPKVAGQILQKWLR
ncbi:MAG: Asp-tRNA(Asn)/Glu-tRNA(Gln) amidotransferase subunit GatB [Candidatus Paceibacterota bacterium]|jgi:aspartyl-tRNA(Asn)/glutamyl-tRNA(Gln) amidotransferase subunit B|nr:Asp-tRNA(Asn)/Glu-tRNA(Gln) amidotransferase subunit GatB [Candidatus Paceibacterota bacterium]